MFAGLKNVSEAGCPKDSVPAKAIRAWQKYRESEQELGNISIIHLDVTREDLLYESVDVIRAHLPAGQDGDFSAMKSRDFVTSGLIACRYLGSSLHEWHHVQRLVGPAGNFPLGHDFENECCRRFEDSEDVSESFEELEWQDFDHRNQR